jgi:hypothetical protein
MLNCYSLNIKLNYHSLDIICHLSFDVNYNVLNFNITLFFAFSLLQNVDAIY